VIRIYQRRHESDLLGAAKLPRQDIGRMLLYALSLHLDARPLYQPEHYTERVGTATKVASMLAVRKRVGITEAER